MKQFIALIALVCMTSMVSLAQGDLYVGGKARVYVEDPTGLRLRNGPDVTYTVVESLFSGEMVNILDGPEQNGGYTWWYVRSYSGYLGWAVESADGVQTLIPVPPTVAPPTSAPVEAIPQITPTAYATVSASLYKSYVDSAFWDTLPLFTVVVQGPTYMMMWTPGPRSVAVGRHDGTIAFHNVDQYLFEIERNQMPPLHIPTLDSGIVPEYFSFNERYSQMVKITGPGILDDAASASEQTIYYDYSIYEIGGVINNVPWPYDSIIEEIIWLDTPAPVVQSVCADAEIASIQYAQGTLQAGNPAQFIPATGDAMPLGDGSGGIAWIDESATVLIWSAIGEDSTGTAEVWDISTGELILRVPHASAYKGKCGVEARPAALSPDGSRLATVVQMTDSSDLLMIFELE